MSQGVSNSAAGTIRVRDLSRRFGSTVALHPTSFEIGPGGVTALLGPNGSGKSTLMRSLVGLVRPDTGVATLDGVELIGDGTQVRKRCTFAPGELNLYKEMRGEEHLAWLLRGREPDSIARAVKMAQDMALPLRARVRAYSHGMKRQLLFCAAMAPRVPIRILDEPSEGLDPSKRGMILDLVERDAAQGSTILLSSHHLGEIDRCSSRMLFMHNGRLVKSEDSSSVRARAARILRLDFGSALGEPARAAAICAELLALGAKGAVVRGRRVVIELATDDPRPLLGAASACPRLPRPEGIEYGQLSLGELYRDVYGVEAV